MHFLPFTADEYEERLMNVRQKMFQQNLDALIITEPESIYYFSGFRAVMTSTVSPVPVVLLPVDKEIDLTS